MTTDNIRYRGYPPSLAVEVVALDSTGFRTIHSRMTAGSMRGLSDPFGPATARRAQQLPDSQP